MRNIKIPVLTAFVCLAFCMAWSQDSGKGEVSDKTDGTEVRQDDTGSGASVLNDRKNDPGSIKGDNTGNVARDDSGKAVKKEKFSDKTGSKTGSGDSGKAQAEEKTSETPSGSYDGELLQINEGDFKYRRIPDIKLPEKNIEMASNQSADSGSENANGDSGFLGMSKTAADIIVKGGIILFILVVFVVYKSRMRSPGGRKSGSSVLNSYRK